MLQGLSGVGARARKLRGAMSLLEVLLWRELRKRPGGFKFRRQHPAGPYVADFYCHEAPLIIEIDGAAHDMGDKPARDSERDAWFAQRQLNVLRISAKHVLTDSTSVVEAVVALAAESAYKAE